MYVSIKGCFIVAVANIAATGKSRVAETDAETDAEPNADAHSNVFAAIPPSLNVAPTFK